MRFIIDNLHIIFLASIATLIAVCFVFFVSDTIISTGIAHKKVYDMNFGELMFFIVVASYLLKK